MRLQYDEPLSNFAFTFNLRRYTEVMAVNAFELISVSAGRVLTMHEFVSRGAVKFVVSAVEARRCRLTVSKPVLNAPMASALEAKTCLI